MNKKSKLVYLATAIYAAEYGAPAIEFNEVFQNRKDAQKRILDSVARECEHGDQNELNEDEYLEASGNFANTGECVIDRGEGNIMHWFMKPIEIQ